jgi:hypothetical protein
MTNGGGAESIIQALENLTYQHVALALNGEIVLTSEAPVGGAFKANGFTITGKQFLIEGDQAAIQAYGKQIPAPGDFFGTSLGEVKALAAFGPRVMGSVMTAPALTSSTNDWNPAASGVALRECSRVKMSATSAVNLTGISSAGVADGQCVTLINTGANAITLRHFDSGSAAANRFGLPSSANVVVPQLGTVTIMYDAQSALWNQVV